MVCWLGKSVPQEGPRFSSFFSPTGLKTQFLWKNSGWASEIITDLYHLDSSLRNRNCISSLDGNHKVVGQTPRQYPFQHLQKANCFKSYSVSLSQVSDDIYKLALTHLVICLKWERLKSHSPWDWIFKDNKVRQRHNSNDTRQYLLLWEYPGQNLGFEKYSQSSQTRYITSVLAAPLPMLTYLFKWTVIFYP